MVLGWLLRGGGYQIALGEAAPDASSDYFVAARQFLRVLPALANLAAAVVERRGRSSATVAALLGYGLALAEYSLLVSTQRGLPSDVSPSSIHSSEAELDRGTNGAQGNNMYATRTDRKQATTVAVSVT